MLWFSNDLVMKIQLLPLFDTLEHLHKNPESTILPHPRFQQDFNHALNFLKSYNGSLGTFNSYRRETERLLQWCWHVKGATLPELKRDDIEQFIRFCQNPPPHWIGLKKVPRFTNQNGKRIPNLQWKPFVVTVTKSARKRGDSPAESRFKLSQGAIQEMFAILSTLFNFLIAEEYLVSNPVALMRQKSKFIRKHQQTAPIRRLSLLQWEAVLQAAENLATETPEKHERTRFILSMLYGMYLRISELAASDRWIPTMNNFAKDSNGFWWFTTVGKGNKERQIAVSEAMLNSLIRWRTFLGLSPLPSPADNSPLIPRLRGHGPMSDTAPLRRLVQQCFDLAAEQLRLKNQLEEADNLADATVHWLRHTGISEDVKIRPREHVRDDAGHSSSATTDRYIDVELQERYRSAQKKTITPKF
ncbi:site specific recombinase, phage integrase family [Legionella longbeachae]|uniref:Site specific recombinase, phage integrase family n=2 Tax=Legionella oakridgensis TaxID=29423 RepID=A0A0W0WX32_9GAMM|nr:site-specific recombinase XerD [Legionella oakridgensis RV-2-2007]KTD36875.1 site specific recombinase, phage integrase family [Legionella oakridgensis]STY19612.1 site specific recombinase, phage integrase family [Legionella longbeachae]